MSRTDESVELDWATAERPAARAAQRTLAEELTTLVHGEEECRRVVEAHGGHVKIT